MTDAPNSEADNKLFHLVYDGLDELFNEAINTIGAEYPDVDVHKLFTDAVAFTLPAKVMEWNGELSAVIDARHQFMQGCDCVVMEWPKDELTPHPPQRPTLSVVP